MAKKKPRTPPPPRPVQAPQRRTGPARGKTPPPDAGDGHRKVLYALAGSGALALLVVVLVIVFAGGSGGGAKSEQHVASLMAAAGCTFKSVKAYVPKGQGTHVDSLTKKLPWNTDPPSNGQHYPLWAVWGFYTQAINPRQVVHNEEHGGVILWWGPKVSKATVAKLQAFYDAEPDGTFGTPYPDLGSKVAITAWTGNTSDYQQNGYYGEGHIAKCPAYTPATEKAFTAFRDAYRGHGPEGIPLSADEPGDGPSS